MAERTSSMGSKTMLARLLTQERIEGSDREIAATHEINRQSTVKEIIAHVFFMSKFGIISSPLDVGEAKSQYFRAKGEHQAAHTAPGQILQGTTPIQELLTGSDDLRITVENLFGKTDGIHAKFNKADSRAEENGLRNALLAACTFTAQKARYARFNRTDHIHPYLATAFDIYKSSALLAYRMAEARQNALMNRLDPNDVAAREEIIAILRWYGQTLSVSQNSHETVLGLFLEDIWRDYSDL
jgi:hypothetical protein